MPQPACPGQSCVVDPPDAALCGAHAIQLTVDDGSPLCGAAASNVGSYTKVTSVTATP